MRKIDLDAERKFENRKAQGEDVRASQSKYYWAIALPVKLHVRKTCDAIRNKNVLEIGCASGFDATSYVRYAANYVGVDISDEAVKNAKALSLQNAEFICIDGHRIPKPNASLDCVIVNSLLHHLDLEITFKEIGRLLKDDGLLIFKEPLGTNPIFQIYRKLTPSARTADERPFNFADLALMRRYFSFHDVQWFGFTNILSAFIRNQTLRLLLTKLDHAVSLTPLKYFYWQFSGIAMLKKNSLS